jgi:hypothetical protein
VQEIGGHYFEIHAADVLRNELAANNRSTIVVSLAEAGRLLAVGSRKAWQQKSVGGFKKWRAWMEYKCEILNWYLLDTFVMA